MQGAILHPTPWRAYATCTILTFVMAGRFFKQWRKYRGLTLEQVADRLAILDDPGVPTTAASISRLEGGKQAYTERSLEALATVYECEAHELLSVDPFKRDELDELMAGMTGKSEIERARTARFLRALNASEEEESRNAAVT